MTKKQTMIKALHWIEENEHGGKISDSMIPDELRPAIEEVLGNAWRTIDRGEVGYVDVCGDSISLVREQYGIMESPGYGRLARRLGH